MRTALVLSGAAEVVQERMGPKFSQDRIYALREPRMEMFTEEEIALVDRVIEELRPLHWTQLSAATHDTPGWKAAKIGADIPYETAFFTTEGTEAQHRKARDTARRLAAARA